jgi:hypothetical protein
LLKKLRNDYRDFGRGEEANLGTIKTRKLDPMKFRVGIGYALV